MANKTYVTYDAATLQLTGAYIQDMPLAHLSNSIVVNDADYANWTAMQANAARTGLVPRAVAAVVPNRDQYHAAIDAWLDAAVQVREYSTIVSACSFAGPGNTRFEKEGAACKAWRAAVWAKAQSVGEDIAARKIAPPTIPDLLAMLPQLVWP